MASTKQPAAGIRYLQRMAMVKKFCALPILGICGVADDGRVQKYKQQYGYVIVLLLRKRIVHLFSSLLHIPGNQSRLHDTIYLINKQQHEILRIV